MINWSTCQRSWWENWGKGFTHLTLESLIKKSAFFYRGVNCLFFTVQHLMFVYFEMTLKTITRKWHEISNKLNNWRFLIPPCDITAKFFGGVWVNKSKRTRCTLVSSALSDSWERYVTARTCVWVTQSPASTYFPVAMLTPLSSLSLSLPRHVSLLFMNQL